MSLRSAHLELPAASMHFAVSPDNLLFFCSVSALVAAFFGVFSLYRRLRPGAAPPAGDLEEEHEPLTAASSLPAFMYNRLLRHSGKGASSTECAVCLGVIQVGDMAKLLPACAHVYHVDCIDLWLASRSTCPLCRRRVDEHSVAGQEASQHLASLSPA